MNETHWKNPGVPATAFLCGVQDNNARKLLTVFCVSVVLSVAVSPFVPSIPALLVWAMVPLLLLILLMPTSVSVGDDGMVYGRLYGKRFLSYAAIRSLRPTARGVAITLRTEEEVHCSVTFSSPPVIEGIQRQMEERLAEWERSAKEPLARGSGDGPAPLPVSVQTAPYRSSTDLGALAQLAFRPDAEPDARMTAIQELARNADPRLRAAFLELSQGTVEPRVHALLRKVARGA